MTKYRGTIAYRTGLGGNVPEGFAASLVTAWDFLVRETCSSEHLKEDITQGCGTMPAFHFMRGLSCMLHDSANQIAEGFLGDWVLMLDTDHVFRSDAFYEMVTVFEGNNGANEPLDILTGFAQKRQPPYLPIIQKTNFDPLIAFEPIIPGPIDKHTLIPIDAAGLACVMVRRKVFDAIRKRLGELPFDFRMKFLPPTLDPDIRPNESVYWGPRLIIPKDRRSDEFYWEDISFFWRAALLGFKSYCAPWIKFHHIETRLVTDDMMQLEKESPIPR